MVVVRGKERPEAVESNRGDFIGQHPVADMKQPARRGMLNIGCLRNRHMSNLEIFPSTETGCVSYVASSLSMKNSAQHATR